MQNAVSKTICIFTLAFLVMSVTGAAAICNHVKQKSIHSISALLRTMVTYSPTTSEKISKS